MPATFNVVARAVMGTLTKSKNNQMKPSEDKF
jgi:hypothetical protein